MSMLPTNQEASMDQPAAAGGAAAAPRPVRRSLLLVDDEQNILSALKRLLRGEGYQIRTANGGQEGLALLAEQEADVIVSDQRMPGMLGADFLRAAKQAYPNTIRIMLSGYTELQSVTDAVNEGAIFKFLTKPWDDEQLRGHIAEAFRLKESADDNARLNHALRLANEQLAATNEKMQALLQQQQQQIYCDEVSLSVARDVLECLPLAVLGVDDAGMVVFVNAAASALFQPNRAGATLLGSTAASLLPAVTLHGSVKTLTRHTARIGAQAYEVLVHPMGAHSSSCGFLLTFCCCEDLP